MLTTLQNRIKSLLEADAWFSGDQVDILTEDRGELYYDIEAAVSRVNGGVVISIITPTLRPAAGDPSKRKLKTECGITLALFENPILTESAKTVDAALPRVLQLVHGQWSGVGAANVPDDSPNRFHFVGGQLVPDTPGYKIYEIDFQTTINLQRDQLPTSGS